ncbi:MAG: hypothetical protein J6B89_03325 [Bacilli bacterium]|nr:hypothetical protein [Bacilli bacterium]
MKNLKVRASAFLTAGSMLFTMVGCNKKDHLLEDTLLDKTIVATVDGDISVLKERNSREGTLLGSNESNIAEHVHYLDVVNGQWITDDAKNCCNRSVIKVNSIEKEGNILSYLTEEEMLKAKDDSLTEDDIISILYRIKENVHENENIKIK